MRAIRLDAFGQPRDLTLHETPRPAVGDDEVLVQVHAAAVNPSDVKNVQGSMEHTTLPRIPGRDFAGTVAEGPPELVGTEVWGTGGDLGFVRDGTHAEYLMAPRAAAQPKPQSLSMEEAAAIGVGFVTAWSALVTLGELGGGETVLITGAAGAVGSAAVQIACWRGARVIGAIRDASEREAAEQAGVHEIVDTGRQALRDRVLELTGDEGVRLAFDTVGGPLFEPCLTALSVRGRQVAITTSGQRRVSFDLLNFYRRELRLFGLNTLELSVVDCGRILAQLSPGFEAGALRPPVIAARYPLEQAAAAYEQVMTGAPGKVILLL